MSSTSQPIKPPHPLDSYRTRSGYYDEYVDDKGKPRDHWQTVSKLFKNLTPEELAVRDKQLKRIVKDNGITYNVYSENEAESRPWVMNMLPMVLGGAEMRELESSLGQRAELFNRVFKDLYGPQQLVKDGLLPSYLAFSNPHFLRACHNWSNQAENPVHLYVADLARAPDGRWWVLSDRLEAASGLGYALENRLLSSRVFPSILRQLGVRTLDHFLSNLCGSYEALAPNNRDNPRVVMLTPGPANETYFEQSFLARNLGYSLVEGADLTVRDNRVFLKTISGVKEIDVLLRRVDSDWCDPLELNSHSLLGVPGLLDAMRERRVAIANQLGAGALESAAFSAFMPSLARHFFGEDLKVPSVATWWCGQPKEADYVKENLHRLVLKPTFRTLNNWQAVFGPNLSESGLERWRRRLTERPMDFTAQELVDQGTTPVYENGRLEARHFLLRVYLHPGKDGWSMMPGGLARIASEKDSVQVSMQQGGESKDVWVLLDEQDSKRDVVTLRGGPMRQIRRGSFDLPSRVADNFFWLGRYVERTEGMTRVLQMILSSILGETESSDNNTIAPFLGYFMDDKSVAELMDAKSGQLKMDQVMRRLALQIRDRRNVESLVSNIHNLQRTAFKVKERLSAQTWQELQRLNELGRVAATQRKVDDEETLLVLEDTLRIIAGFSGLTMENMTRGQNWLFLELGRRIERTLVLIHLLNAAFERDCGNEENVLGKVLRCADSSMTYRRRYLTNLNMASTLDLLIMENTNPRSLVFQSEMIRERLNHLPHHLIRTSPNQIDQFALAVHSRIGLADMDTLLKVDKSGERSAFQAFANNLKNDLYKLAMQIEQYYFAHTGPSLLTPHIPEI